MPRDIDLSRFDRRRQPLDDTNRTFDELAERPDILRGFDRFLIKAEDAVERPD